MVSSIVLGTIIFFSTVTGVFVCVVMYVHVLVATDVVPGILDPKFSAFVHVTILVVVKFVVEHPHSAVVAASTVVVTGVLVFFILVTTDVVVAVAIVIVSINATACVVLVFRVAFLVAILVDAASITDTDVAGLCVRRLLHGLRNGVGNSDGGIHLF